jgi:Lrp/AsnC family transcriptional regulator for asnA, asnC and gidA
MAWIGFVVDNSATGDVATALVEVPEIDYVVISSGAFNVMAEVACRSQADLYRLILRVRGIPGVQRTETFMYLRLLRQQYQWAQDGSASPVPAGVVEDSVELDPLDIALIAELEHDGRAPFRALARRLGTSERQVSTRFSRLVEQQVLQVIAVANPLTMGFEAMAWLGINLREGANPELVSEQLGTIRRIGYVVIAAGRYDIMAEIYCRSREELLDVLERQIGAIKDITHIESFYYLRLLYRSTAGGWGAARSLAAPRHPPTRKRTAAKRPD